MSSLIGILSLLLAFPATSYSLTCTECTSTSSSCSGSSITCPSGFQCGAVFTETNAAGRIIKAIARSCTIKSKCNQKGSISTEYGVIKMVAACCNSDYCTPEKPRFPEQSYNPNGLICRSCVSADSTWCYTSDTMQCTGDENMCLLQTTKIQGPVSSSEAIRGCATKSICDLGSESSIIGDFPSELRFICTSGGTSIHKVILTPAIACLLLMMLIF